MLFRLNANHQGVIAVMRWIARVLHKIAISAKLARTPTVATYPRPRQRHIVSVNTVGSVDTIDDMRHVIAALGGWERHDSEVSDTLTNSSTEASTLAARKSRSQGAESDRRDVSFDSVPPSIRVAARATKTRPGILIWKGKGKQTAPSTHSYSEGEDLQEFLEARMIPLRDHERASRVQGMPDCSATESSRDTEIASIILNRSFGHGLRRRRTSQTI